MKVEYINEDGPLFATEKLDSRRLHTKAFDVISRSRMRLVRALRQSRSLATSA
jgi:hypothetical protein